MGWSAIGVLKWLWKSIIAFSGHVVAASVVLIIFTALKALRDDNTFSYYLSNWRELVSPALVTLLVMTVVSLYMMVHRQKKTLSSFGVRLFSKHDGAEAKGRDWSLMKKDLVSASAEKSALWVLGATGKETFSGSASPLFDSLRAYEGDIKILLIQPMSFAFNSRCRGLRMSHDGYLEEILDSIDYCRDLLKRGRSVELKLYHTLPIWKMLMMSRVLWVQYYKENMHVDDTPMYCFEFRGDGATLFDGFRSVFQKRWNLDDSKLVDLSRFVRSSWEETCLTNPPH